VGFLAFASRKGRVLLAFFANQTGKKWFFIF
jgi:hypothetical protein